MGMRKILIAVAAMLCILILWSGAAMAGKKWYVCSVGLIGPAGSNGSVYVKLTDTDHNPPKFDGKWFQCREGREKEMLAVLLTAATNDLNVKVYTDPNDSGKPILYNVYLKP